ncbi:MAG: GNAT family N-acetyltransferase [Acidimicrobiales bacterium]
MTSRENVTEGGDGAEPVTDTGTGPGDDTTCVRAYRNEDRAAVRRICHWTGYMGEPAWYWRDQESFADLFTGYYTDHEPGSASVCETAGEVTGYLLGCADSARAPDPAAVFLRSVARRGLLLRPGTAPFVWRSMADGVVEGVRGHPLPSPFSDPRWPAHLHIDLLASARGRGLGALLVRRWLDTLRSWSVPGCHLETLAENTGAVSFFEAMGFTRYRGPDLLPGMRTRQGGRIHLLVMVQDL